MGFRMKPMFMSLSTAGCVVYMSLMVVVQRYSLCFMACGVHLSGAVLAFCSRARDCHINGGCGLRTVEF
jgi:hypothetical protein